jgi:hypothetical protein
LYFFDAKFAVELMNRFFTLIRYYFGFNAVGFSHGRKASFLGLLAERWGLLAFVVDLLAESGRVLAHDHRLLAFSGSLLAERWGLLALVADLLAESG